MNNQEYIIEKFIQSICILCPRITSEAIKYFTKNLLVSEFPPKYFIIKEGMLQNNIYYVATGLIRAFYINNKGEEINVSFIKEGEFAIHYEAFVTQKKSKYYFQSIEPTIVIHIPYEHIWDCCDRFPSMDRYLRLILERELYLKQKRIDSFIFDNAETRYINFIKNEPELFSRLTISYLSSYLGIERQTLTRIRKKLVK